MENCERLESPRAGHAPWMRLAAVLTSLCAACSGPDSTTRPVATDASATVSLPDAPLVTLLDDAYYPTSIAVGPRHQDVLFTNRIGGYGNYPPTVCTFTDSASGEHEATCKSTPLPSGRNYGELVLLHRAASSPAVLGVDIELEQLEFRSCGTARTWSYSPSSPMPHSMLLGGFVRADGWVLAQDFDKMLRFRVDVEGEPATLPGRFPSARIVGSHMYWTTAQGDPSLGGEDAEAVDLHVLDLDASSPGPERALLAGSLPFRRAVVQDVCSSGEHTAVLFKEWRTDNAVGVALLGRDMRINEYMSLQARLPPRYSVSCAPGVLSISWPDRRPGPGFNVSRWECSTGRCKLDEAEFAGLEVGRMDGVVAVGSLGARVLVALRDRTGGQPVIRWKLGTVPDLSTVPWTEMRVPLDAATSSGPSIEAVYPRDDGAILILTSRKTTQALRLDASGKPAPLHVRQ